jgi:hypothetical protein
MPASVRLVDACIEICDGEPMRMPAAVDEFFGLSTGDRNAQSAQWCPRESRPIAVRPVAAP